MPAVVQDADNREGEMQSRRRRHGVVFVAILAAGLAWSSAVFSSEQVRGVITARGDDGTLALRADDASNVVVVVADFTKVKRVDGFRELKTTAADLIPGLRIRVKGDRQSADRLVASDISFTRTDLKIALAIHGGVDAIERRSVANSQRIQ